MDDGMEGDRMTEEEQERAHELLYSCDSREELCERIAELETLAMDAVARLRLAKLSSYRIEKRVLMLELEEKE